MKPRRAVAILAWVAICAVVVGCSGDEHPVTQAEEDAINTRLEALEARFTLHAQVSKTWAWRIKQAVDCLEKREYGFPEPVVDSLGVVIDCAQPPVDPPSPPPPNGGWGDGG